MAATTIRFDNVRITMRSKADGPNENVIVQEIEKPHKLEAGPIMRQVISAVSMYPAHFVCIGSNSMKVFNPAAQKIPVENRQCEEPKRGKCVQLKP